MVDPKKRIKKPSILKLPVEEFQCIGEIERSLGLKLTPEHLRSPLSKNYYFVSHGHVTKLQIREKTIQILKSPEMQDNNAKSNDVWNIPACIQNLQFLQVLYISGTLYDAPESDVLPRYMQEKRFATIHLPQAINRLKNLEHLEIWDCKLRSFPENWTSLERLKTVVLVRCQLEEFPEQACRLPHVITLRLRGNHLRTLPPAFQDMQSIRVLHLGDNDFDAVPPHIKTLTRLRVLEISGKSTGSPKIRELDNWIGSLRYLIKLDLSNQDLSSLPERIGEFAHLREIDLSKNHFETLPDVFARLQNLQKVNLDQNRFTRIPWVLGCLVNLSNYSGLRIQENPWDDISKNIIHELYEEEDEMRADFEKVNILKKQGLTAEASRAYSEAKQKWSPHHFVRRPELHMDVLTDFCRKEADRLHKTCPK